MANRDYYANPPHLQRTHQQIMAAMVRTEPKSGGAAIILRWLIQDAVNIGPA